MPHSRLDRFNELFLTLRFRLTLWNTLVVAITIVVTMVAVREGLRIALLHETDQLLQEDTIELGMAVKEFYPDLAQIHDEMNRKALGHEYRELFVQVLDPTGNSVWSSVHTPKHNLPQIPTEANTAPRTVAGFRMVQRQLHHAGQPQYTIRVGCSLAHLEEDVNKLTRLMLGVASVLLVVAPLGGYWLAGRATKPLGDIIRTAAALRPTRMDERLPIRHTGDELDQLSLTINRLLDRIGEYLDRNREFIANAAHELRSPLAAIRSAVEVALNADRSTTEYKELLYDIVDECGHLGALVNQLLILAESDSAAAAVDSEPVRLDQVVEKALDMFQGAAEERSLRLRASYLAPISVRGDATRLRQVVNNLIDNGIKFTEPGGAVTVYLYLDADPKLVLLRVSDTGVGIPPQDLPFVFERFYRVDKSRHRELQTRGNGLGLSICQAIVTAHGGRIEAESRPGQGTTFKVYLPAYVEAPVADSASAAAVG